MLYNFYDTCSLLLLADSIDSMEIKKDERIVISSITAQELENIKTSANKSEDVKYAARKIMHWLQEHPDLYDVSIYTDESLKHVSGYGLEITNDLKIISCACDARNRYPNDNFHFITNDLCCGCIASLFFDEIYSEEPEKDDYTGYKEVYLDELEMGYFYNDMNFNINKFNLKINEYLIVREAETKEAVDFLCWTGESYRHVTYGNFKSKYFGEVKPFKNDPYQILAADSFMNNKITMIKGPAGTGKTFLSLGFLLSKLEKNKIDKIIIFCNTVATKNSAKLGYYPGTKDEKLLDSQIGNLLSSKIGGKIEVERMIQEEKLVLLPLSDIRGYDTSGMRAGIYISEAQNLDVSLMKLALQRIGEDSICIIDGDCHAQVDDINFAGPNNGMRRASKIFRGHDVYGEIELKAIHRSKIAQIAEGM